MTSRKDKRTQKGQIFRSGKSWYGRWRRDEPVRVEDLNVEERERFDKLRLAADGAKVIVRRQHCELLCEFSDRYRSKKDVQPLLDTKLLRENENRDNPESTQSVAEYAGNYFLPYAERELKQSTAYGYKNIFRIYLKPRLANIALRDFRCVDATRLLSEIHQHHQLGKKSLRHCKGLLSTIFTHAKRAGVLDGENPAQDADIPRAAKASAPTHAYSGEEVLAMLNVLTGVAKKSRWPDVLLRITSRGSSSGALGRLRRQNNPRALKHVANACDRTENGRVSRAGSGGRNASRHSCRVAL